MRNRKSRSVPVLVLVLVPVHVHPIPPTTHHPPPPTPTAPQLWASKSGMETLAASWPPHRGRLLRFRGLDYEGINLLIAKCARLVTKLQSCEICTPDAGLRFLSGREGGEEKEEIGSQRKGGKGDAEQEEENEKQRSQKALLRRLHCIFYVTSLKFGKWGGPA